MPPVITAIHATLNRNLWYASEGDTQEEMDSVIRETEQAFRAVMAREYPLAEVYLRVVDYPEWRKRVDDARIDFTGEYDISDFGDPIYPLEWICSQLDECYQSAWENLKAGKPTSLNNSNFNTRE